MSKQLMLKYGQQGEFVKSLFEEVDETALIHELAQLYLLFFQARKAEDEVDDRDGE